MLLSLSSQAMMRLFVMAVALAGLALPACHKPAVSVEPTRADVVGDQAAFDRLWDTSLDVLRRHHYTIDRLDPAEGVISTKAETSQQWFEFWRKDVATSYDHFEASLTPVRRKITLTFGPLGSEGDGSGWNLAVEVEKQRLRSPERQYNSSASALRIFGDDLPGAAGDAQLTSASDTWQTVGRDSAFEEYLLNKILTQAKLSAEPAA